MQTSMENIKGRKLKTSYITYIKTGTSLGSVGVKKLGGGRGVGGTGTGRGVNAAKGPARFYKKKK